MRVALSTVALVFVVALSMSAQSGPAVPPQKPVPDVTALVSRLNLDSYKATRATTPDILREQMGLVRQVVTTLGLPIVEIVGWEADDVIATLSDQAVTHGDDVIIVTGDRDSYQLVSDPHVRVLYNKRGVSDYALYDEAGIGNVPRHTRVSLDGARVLSVT